MNIAELQTTILKNTFTTSDYNRRVTYLRQYIEHIFFKSDYNMQLFEFLKKNDAPAADIEAMSLWGNDFYRIITKENTYEALKALIDDLENLPTVTLYLPFHPDEAVKTRLGTWLRSNVAPNALFSIVLDINTIGGCGIAYKGIRKDFTLRYYIEKHRKDIFSYIEHLKEQ